MARIKFDHVVSCSSEDPIHNSSNLLNNDINKKWKCKSVGESSATVILQFNKSYKISGIDIGNESTSFVEVFVGRSSSQESNYEIFLAMSSFMTPMEARDLSNCNRVRLFTAKDFAKQACDEKWDRIKIVCTQPFNKNVQYGLSFIVAHAAEEQNTETINLGKFTLKGSDSPDYIAPGNLFSKRNETPSKNTERLSTALEMKRASTTEWLEKHGAPKCKPVKIKPSVSENISTKNGNGDTKNRNSLDIYYDPEDDAPHEKIDTFMSKLKEENKKKRQEIEESTPKKTPKKNTTETLKRDKKLTQSPSTSNKKTPKTSTDPKPGPSSTSSNKRKTDRKLDTPEKKIKLETKAFHELLRGVVFTISGIQNPERANLRQLALNMGGKYKPDWDNTCTHLICAFANTPKFQQVQGKGKIVTKSWIQDCHSQRKRLPWRRYALDRNDIGKPESEDEICERIDEPNCTEDDETHNSNVKEYKSDSTDTEDEIERILARQKVQQISNRYNNDKKPFEVETDEEILDKQPADILCDLPKLFTNQMFYVDDIFNEEEKDKLERLIKALNGFVMHRLASLLDFIITNKKSVKDLKNRCPTAKCVNPQWIYECANMQKLLSCEKYILT